MLVVAQAPVSKEAAAAAKASLMKQQREELDAAIQLRAAKQASERAFELSLLAGARRECVVVPVAWAVCPCPLAPIPPH